MGLTDIAEQRSLLSYAATGGMQYVLRRLTAGGKISDLEGSMSHRDLMSRPITLLPFDPFAERVWALRNNVSSYDAWYVAMVRDELGFWRDGI